MKFDNTTIRTIVESVIAAQHTQLPGFAKQAYATARVAQALSNSPPPTWIWVVVLFLEKFIPELVSWLKKQHGDDWAAQGAETLIATVQSWLS